MAELERKCHFTMKRRGVKGGGWGNTCLRLIEDRNSRIAEAEFAFRDACSSCIFGSSSDMTNIITSRGNLEYIRELLYTVNAHRFFTLVARM